MEKSKTTVDRVRPILQAMERSIDAARQRRTHQDTPEDAGASSHDHTNDGAGNNGTIDAETASTMRARPKRPRGFDDVRPIPPDGPRTLDH